MYELLKHLMMLMLESANQTLQERVGKNPYNQAQFVKNQAKWAAAAQWCQQNGLKFRVINEQDIFHNAGKKR